MSFRKDLLAEKLLFYNGHQRKKLSRTTELFIVIAIFLGIILILGGVPEAAEFFKPGKVTLPTKIIPPPTIKACVRGTPTMAPYNSPQTGKPGLPLDFGFRYSIPDSVDCNETNIELLYTCPPELFCVWTRIKFSTLVPLNGTAGNQIIADCNANPGTYNFTAKITNLENNQSAITTAQYVVVGPPEKTTPTLNLTYSPANPQPFQNVIINATASDDTEVKWIEMYLDGAFQKSCAIMAAKGSCSFVANFTAAGTHSASVRTVDTCYNENDASINFNVTIGGGGGGGGGCLKPPCQVMQ